MSSPASNPSTTRRAMMLAVGLIASVVTLAVGAQVASAHHSEIAASVDCTGTVSYTASSWSGNVATLDGKNTKIEVGYRIPPAGSNVFVKYGAFLASKPGSPGTPDSFSGTFAWPASNPASIVVYSKPIDNWGNGNTSKDGRSTTITRPVSCPAVPAASIVGSCVNDKGNVAVTLSNTGGSDVVLTVQFNGGAVTPYTVPKNSSLPAINFPGLENGSYPVVVKNGQATVASQTIVVACKPAMPAASIVGSCVNDAGNVAVTLSNTGDFDVVLTVQFNGGAVTPYTVPKNSSLPAINFPGLENGSYPVVVKNGDTVVAEKSIVVACAPANPAALIAGSCVNNKGNVAVTLSNTGDSDVVLTVQFNGGAVTPYTVPKNGSLPTINFGDLANGSYPVVVKNGETVVAETMIAVACEPGTGTAVATYVCSGFDGTVTITMTNTGGDFPVDFVIDGQTYTIAKGGPPQTVTFSNVPDGPFTKDVTINGVPSTLTVEVACDAKLAGAPICNEVDVNNVVTIYWYTITNLGPVDVPITWADGSATVPGNGSVKIKSASPSVSVKNGETTAVSVQATDDICGKIVVFEKKLLGQPPTGETYTIRVSRLVAPDYVTYLTFDIQAGVPKQFELPSSLDGAGITYKIEEISVGTASTHTVSPDTFSLQGNLGETVSVVVTNGYASVSIDKQVSRTTVKGGETLSYTLVGTNTGGLTLDPVVISDLLPPKLSMVSALVAGNKGTCTLIKTTRPQLLSCDLNDALAPGASTAAITIVALVDDDTPVGSTLINQAKVLGTYVGAPDPVTGLTQSVTPAARSAEIARLRIQADGDALSCVPVVTGTVCDLSAQVGSLVEAKTESQPPATPPAPAPDPAPPVAPPLGQLPVTGTSGMSALLTIGFVLTCLGGVILFARRRTSRS